MNKLEKSYEAYEQKRAQNKYDGKAEAVFPIEEFRKCADYLTGMLEGAAFDAEDIGDVVRVALSNRKKADGVQAGVPGAAR